MPVTITNVQNLQELEVGISGPGDATRMFMIAGTASVSLSASAAVNQSQQQKETFALHVGPELTSEQFVKALVVASPAQTSFGQWGDPASSTVQWAVGFADADFDDDAGKTQARFEMSLYVTGASAQISQIAFQATILATDATD
jgi:hypothetical protein